MVGMLVRDDDGTNEADIHAELAGAQKELPAGDAAVNEHKPIRPLDERCVTF